MKQKVEHLRRHSDVATTDRLIMKNGNERRNCLLQVRLCSFPITKLTRNLTKQYTKERNQQYCILYEKKKKKEKEIKNCNFLGM